MRRIIFEFVWLLIGILGVWGILLRLQDGAKKHDIQHTCEERGPELGFMGLTPEGGMRYEPTGRTIWLCDGEVLVW